MRVRLGVIYPCKGLGAQGIVGLQIAYLSCRDAAPCAGRRQPPICLIMHRFATLPALAALIGLIGLIVPLSGVGAQENPLLSPPPGLAGAPVSPSPLDAERGRMQVDTMRGRSDLSTIPTPDPMRQREADSLRLDADRALRALQDPPAPSAPDAIIDGPSPPRIDPPAPRVSHGRKKGAPTPAQSSPVPERKPDPPSPP